MTDANMFYLMLLLPTLFGITLVGEGLYKMWHYEAGWGSVFLGCLFLSIVTFGYFYLRGLL